MTNKPRILFACKANGGRSVASKVLTEYNGGDALLDDATGSTNSVRAITAVITAVRTGTPLTSR